MVPYNPIRQIKRISTHTKHSMMYQHAELDSRAVTCCAGSTLKVIEYTGQECDVYPYNPQHKPQKNVPMVKAVTAYDSEDGQTTILCLNQTLYFGHEMPNSLLNHNQMPYFGIIVDDCPTFLTPGKQPTHSLYLPDEDVRIPLSLNGCITCIPTQLPTATEINSCQWVILTSEGTWDPYDETFQDMEQNAKQQYNISANNTDRLASMVKTGHMRSQITPPDSSKRCSIGLQSAQNTINMTTHKFIRSSINPMEK
jgi:hypothetical protein